jgi:hypothetical protein
MVIITLIGEHQAKEGEEFVYRGPLTECRDCKLKAVCFNLDPGSAYMITGLREVKHQCRMHEDGVRVVEVEKVPLRCAVSSKLAIEGSTITLNGTRCGNLGCDNYRLCNPTWVTSNPKRRVTVLHGDIKCPDGSKMIEVDLE